MRLDRWFKIHYPGLGFRNCRSCCDPDRCADGGRVKIDARVQPGQMVRVHRSIPISRSKADRSDQGSQTFGRRELLARMLLHEDDKVFVFNKPAGLAVQGGSGVTRNIDGLEAWTQPIRAKASRLGHRPQPRTLPAFWWSASTRARGA